MPSDLAVRPAVRALAPRYWGVHLLMALAVVATLLLGRWQYDVWHRHRTDSAASVTRLDPVPLDSVLGPDAAFPADGLGRPVTVEGTWDTPHTFYVANRERAGRSGFWALTLVTTPSGSQIPVVRGWLPDLGDPPAAPTGHAALVGLLQPSEDTGAPIPGAPTPGAGDSHHVLGEVNITQLLPLTGHDLYGGYVIATDRRVPGSTPSTGTAGLVAADAGHLPGAGTSTALRNLLYAFQWWVFGAFAIFMWWRWLSEDVLGRGRRGDPSDAG